MALTLANALTEVRYNLNETTSSFWSDAEITVWIQEGVRLFSSKTLLVEGTDDIDPLKTDTLNYTSADETWIGNILEPYAAIYYDGSAYYKGLIKIHPRQIGNLALGKTAGAPKYYAMHNRKIYLFPLTSTTVISDGGKVTFLYAKETDDITDLSDEYQHLPIVYATAKAKQKDEKFGQGTALMGQFFQEIAFERADKHARETDSIDNFRIKQRGGGVESAKG